MHCSWKYLSAHGFLASGLQSQQSWGVNSMSRVWCDADSDWVSSQEDTVIRTRPGVWSGERRGTYGMDAAPAIPVMLSTPLLSSRQLRYRHCQLRPPDRHVKCLIHQHPPTTTHTPDTPSLASPPGLGAAFVQCLELTFWPLSTIISWWYSLMLYQVESQLSEMKLLFKHQDLQMFDLKANVPIWVIFTHS